MAPHMTRSSPAVFRTEVLAVGTAWERGCGSKKGEGEGRGDNKKKRTPRTQGWEISY